MVATRIHQLLACGRDWKKESLHLVVMFWKQIGQYTIYRVFLLSTWQNAVFIRLLFLIKRGMKPGGQYSLQVASMTMTQWIVTLGKDFLAFGQDGSLPRHLR